MSQSAVGQQADAATPTAKPKAAPARQQATATNRAPAPPGATASNPLTGDQAFEAAEEHATRTAILRLVLRQGPTSAVQLAGELALAQAGIRRHLNVLESKGLIEERQPVAPNRGRGRPARYFVASQTAHEALAGGADTLAVDVLDYLNQLAGPAASKGFAKHRAGLLAKRYARRVSQAGPVPQERARALATALNEDGFAASLRAGPGGTTMQLCLGHCPIHQVAATYPEICEAETAAIADLLGIHVQRLATLAGGDHVCTTTLPMGGADPSAITTATPSANAGAGQGAS